MGAGVGGGVGGVGVVTATVAAVGAVATRRTQHTAGSGGAKAPLSVVCSEFVAELDARTRRRPAGARIPSRPPRGEHVQPSGGVGQQEDQRATRSSSVPAVALAVRLTVRLGACACVLVSTTSREYLHVKKKHRVVGVKRRSAWGYFLLHR